MEETPTHPTIAELWERLQGYRGSIEKIEILIYPSVLELKSAARMASLAEITRQHLLERCGELVDCTDGHFSINQRLILRISHGEINAFKEGAAILSFWAWELEKRKS